MEERENSIPGSERQKNRLFVRSAYEWVESIAFAVITVVLIFTFLFRIVGVEGQSMEPTLHNGNFIVISDLFFEPRNNDVVVITPTASFDVPIVKRVIATSGQTVDIDFKKGVVYVDGEALDEPYIAEPTNLYYDMRFPQTVPEGCIFVMGDNRNHSLDSRDSSIGMVDTRYVLGKALLRILPVTQIGAIR
ncbi:signal peptidase I [Hydrogenoanaerobacterium sp.]|uniref:signal peptidase I n=1 Tax=Hydrogenoanaerobacterium sp. TaxID=2953763 RepID=UPI00289673F5|nr:signal peptidase I [Hydrogenoanaerobacterium sp.]